MYKNYLFRLKRTNKNGNEVWMCTHKLYNVSITMREGSIIKTFSIKSDGSPEFEHQEKMGINTYECIRSVKRRIDEEPTAPVSSLYEQEVKKFRRENGSAAMIPIFDRAKSSLYEYRSSKHPPVPKSLSSIYVPYPLTRSMMDQHFLFSYNRQASLLCFGSLMSIKLLGDNQHWYGDGTFCQFHFSQNIWRQIKNKD
jgi:hypothetical protein